MGDGVVEREAKKLQKSKIMRNVEAERNKVVTDRKKVATDRKRCDK
jgi:hypothetical protein